MNIFVLDKDPAVAATMLCNKHIGKMALEAAQIISTALAGNNVISDLYTPTHIHHPCCRWAKQSLSNLRWLQIHGIALLFEHDKSYGVFQKNSSRPKYWRTRYILEKVDLALKQSVIPDLGLTEFVQAMPDQYKVAGDAVTAYRTYYKSEKARFAKWTHGRNPPSWWDNICKS